MTKKILSDKQVGRYFQDGYLLVSGLIPDQVSAKAEEKIVTKDKKTDDKSKTVQDTDREKLDVKFAKKEKPKLN